MKKLFIYELYKLISDRFFIATIILLLAINLGVCAISTNSAYPRMFHSSVSSVFDEYNASPTTVLNNYNEYVALSEERDNLFLTAIKNGDFSFEEEPLPNRYAPDGFTDEHIYNLLISNINLKETYQEKIRSVLEQAMKKLEDYRDMGVSPSSFSYTYQENVISCYSPLPNLISFSVDYIYGWDVYFSYTSVNLFIALSIIIGTIIIFTRDIASGFLSIARSTSKGRLHNSVAKLLACCTLCFVVVILFCGFSWLTINLKVGFSSYKYPIQMLKDFILCPFTLSIGTYAVYFVCVKLLVFFAFSIIIALISTLLKTTVLSFIGNLCFYIVQFVLYSTSSVDNDVRNLNLIFLTEVNPIFMRYRAINIVGYAVDFVPFLFMLLVFLIVLISWIATIIYCSLSSSSRISPKKHFPLALNLKFINNNYNKKVRSYPLSCEIYEFHKLILTSRYIILLLLLFFIKCCSTYQSIATTETFSDTIYKNYFQTLSGPLSDEKRNFISLERTTIDSILLKQYDMQHDFFHQTISYTEYKEYLKNYNTAYSKNDVFMSIEQRLRYIEGQLSDGYDAWFVYDSGWNALFSGKVDWTIYIAFILLYTGIFSSEFEQKSSLFGFSQILRTTKYGRNKTFHSKSFVVGFVTVAVTILWNLIDFLAIYIRYDLPFANAPLHSLEVFSNFSLNMSIEQFIPLFYFCKVLASLSLSYLIFSLSAIFKKTLPTITLIVIPTLTPSILSYLNFPFFSQVNFMNFMRAAPMLLQNSSAIFYISTILILCFIAFFHAKRKWNK